MTAWEIIGHIAIGLGVGSFLAVLSVGSFLAVLVMYRWAKTFLG